MELLLAEARLNVAQREAPPRQGARAQWDAAARWLGFGLGFGFGLRLRI